MNEKLQKFWAKCALTLSRQSGRSTVAALAVVLTLPAAAGPINWAHQNGSVQSNGAVTLKSLSGSGFSASGNPSGAVAKANQNAAIQPPTVLIQATGGQYVETIPYLINSSTLPSCPAGYVSSFGLTGVGDLANPIINAGGTRMILRGVRTGSVGEIGQVALYIDTFTGTTLSAVTVSSPGAALPWAARICTR